MLSNIFKKKANDHELPFFMPIEDIFKLKERGVVVVGRVRQGIIHQGDPVDIVGLHDSPTPTSAHALEAFHKPINMAKAGEPIAIMLSDIEAGWLERGMVLASPNSVHAFSCFIADFQVYPPEAMGFPTGEKYPVSSIEFRISYPFQFIGEPRLYIYGRDFQCRVSRMDGGTVNWSEVQPGNQAKLSIQIETPLALKIGWNFNLSVTHSPKLDIVRPIGIGKVTELTR